MTVNPTEKNPRVEDEPWIRDVLAANAMFRFEQPDSLPQLCEGQLYHCEWCGQRFPLWPITEWAAHAVEQHRQELTIQQNQSLMNLCSAGLNTDAKRFLGVQLMTRVILRRRARDLGLIVFLDEKGKPIETPKPRIVQ